MDSKDPHRLLGVDTGGTFTDAVLYDEQTQTVLASAKAPTTPEDLSLGIEHAVRAVLDEAGVAPIDVDMVSLSTTLATNALVEGATRPAGLLAIGFQPPDLERAGLPEALGADPVFHIAGGHDSHGVELTPLDETAVRDAAAGFANVEAVAVTSRFSVRNAAHELRATTILAEQLDLPISCSHHLSEQLNGPKRAVTALLNARLIPITADLMSKLESVLARLGIEAPMMVVRGDGSLVARSFVERRPIETILSGPAASLIGASALAQASTALVADVGGTTTDLALISGGVPRRDGVGAVVGGHATMVDAVDMSTVGIGGDSEIWLDLRSDPPLRLGPRRVLPLSVAAIEHPELLARLERQLRSDPPRETDGGFVFAHGPPPQAAPPAERALWAQVAGSAGPVATEDIDRAATARGALLRLIRHGHLRPIGFTPTDASAVANGHAAHAQPVAALGAALWARRRNRFGEPIADSPDDFAQQVIELLRRRSAEALMAVALEHDGLPAEAATGPLMRRSWEPPYGDAAVTVSIVPNVPIVAVGAAAEVYYPGIATLVGAHLEIPPHAAVANAVGAVVGRVRLQRSVTITAPRRGLFRSHGLGDPTTHYSLDDAMDHCRAALTELMEHDMVEAGAREHELVHEWVERRAEIDGRELFVEGVLTIVGTGRPRLR